MGPGPRFNKSTPFWRLTSLSYTLISIFSFSSFPFLFPPFKQRTWEMPSWSNILLDRVVCLKLQWIDWPIMSASVCVCFGRFAGRVLIWVFGKDFIFWYKCLLGDSVSQLLQFTEFFPFTLAHFILHSTKLHHFNPILSF